MNNSAYLRMKLESDRKIADSLQKGIASTPGAFRKSLNDIYLGMERASWYSSCFFDKYQDVCEELKSEDVRMFMSVIELYKRRDALLDIFKMYVDYVLKDKFKDSDKSSPQELARKGAGIASSKAVGTATKITMSYALAKGLSESVGVSNAVRTMVNARGVTVLTIFQIYGNSQKAALAARRLRSLDPAFYSILYKMKIEMLYIYIEPVLSKVIKNIKSMSSPDYNEIVSIIERVE